jgi:hypothetical protein
LFHLLLLYIHKAAEFPLREGTANSKVFCEDSNIDVRAPELVAM